MTKRLDYLFKPRSIAVIGASRNEKSVGYAILHNLIAGGFTGSIYPVNPKACLLYTSPSPRDVEESRMPSSA